jgi:hypothetical protein
MGCPFDEPCGPDGSASRSRRFAAPFLDSIRCGRIPGHDGDDGQEGDLANYTDIVPVVQVSEVVVERSDR